MEKSKQLGATTGVYRRRVAAALALGATALSVAAFAAPAEAAAGGPTARLQKGTLTVTGTAVRDTVDIAMDHVSLTVDFGSDGTIDGKFSMSRIKALSVNLGDGNDAVSVLGTGVSDIPITIDEGLGDDTAGVISFEDPFLAKTAPVTWTAGAGNDFLSVSVPGAATVGAGAGDDTVITSGSTGPVTVQLGDGNDKYETDPGTFTNNRIETVDAGTGQDTLALVGDDTSDIVNLSAAGAHLIATDSSGSNVDAVGIEDVTYDGKGANGEGRGSGNEIVVNDLTGTGVTNVTPVFSDPLDPTIPNNSFDVVAVIGTPGNDNITVSGSGNDITVAGLTPLVTPRFMNANDTLEIHTGDGQDKVDSSNLQPNLVELFVF